MSLRTAKDFVKWYDIGLPSSRHQNKTGGGRHCNVVFLLGWMECKARDLATISNFYGEKGFAVIRYYPFARSFAAPDADEVLAQHASQLVDVLRLNFLDKSPVYFHCFSYAGAIMYHFTRKRLEETSTSWPIAGTVFDSCPVLVDVTRERGLKRILRNFLHFLSAGSVNESYRLLVLNTCLSLKKRASLCPELFLYSKGDKIADFKSIEAFVVERTQLGVVTHSHVWEDSDHVDHVRCHPEEYIRKVEDFVVARANVDNASSVYSASADLSLSSEERNGSGDNLLSRL